MIKTVKREIRILAFDDGPFESRSKGRTVLVGVIFRGGSFMDGLLKSEIEIDGEDAEDTIINITNKTKHKDQLRVIMLDGITFGGFNTVNIKKISERTRLPVIVYLRQSPDIKLFLEAIGKLPNAEEKRRAVSDAGSVYDVSTGGKKIYYQCHGISKDTAAEIIKKSSTRGLVPEPLRIAHLIATGIVFGESIGRA